jgi:hypothetical protein
MGAGKTTVIGPLVCLMLTDGKTLVGEVVPPALLEFSRSVLRKTFSTVTRKVLILRMTSEHNIIIDLAIAGLYLFL